MFPTFLPSEYWLALGIAMYIAGVLTAPIVLYGEKDDFNWHGHRPRRIVLSIIFYPLVYLWEIASMLARSMPVLSKAIWNAIERFVIWLIRNEPMGGK